MKTRFKEAICYSGSVGLSQICIIDFVSVTLPANACCARGADGYVLKSKTITCPVAGSTPKLSARKSFCWVSHWSSKVSKVIFATTVGSHRAAAPASPSRCPCCRLTAASCLGRNKPPHCKSASTISVLEWLSLGLWITGHARDSVRP